MKTIERGNFIKTLPGSSCDHTDLVLLHLSVASGQAGGRASDGGDLVQESSSGNTLLDEVR